VSDEQFPSVPQALLLIVALFLAEYVAGVVLYDLRHVLALTRSEAVALSMVLGNGALFALLMHVKSMGWRDLLHPASASVRATALLLLPPVLLVGDAGAPLIRPQLGPSPPAGQ
jgi:hypothetical protein